MKFYMNDNKMSSITCQREYVYSRISLITNITFNSQIIPMLGSSLCQSCNGTYSIDYFLCATNLVPHAANLLHQPFPNKEII